VLRERLPLFIAVERKSSETARINVLCQKQQQFIVELKRDRIFTKQLMAAVKELDKNWRLL
jgi:hypothetical protein